MLSSYRAHGVRERMWCLVRNRFLSRVARRVEAHVAQPRFTESALNCLLLKSASEALFNLAKRRRVPRASADDSSRMRTTAPCVAVSISNPHDGASCRLCRQEACSLEYRTGDGSLGQLFELAEPVAADKLQSSERLRPKANTVAEAPNNDQTITAVGSGTASTTTLSTSAPLVPPKGLNCSKPIIVCDPKATN